ncbi:hypothetical protein ROHU_020384 [Labeo rohita]|uniref:Uncharacterized protein n=1 Tax=Labeo rohita TaxID=84645 RepID=A0A498N2E5_LABRO|nr:hypothetical protein ROHU_020384 [Labeo rohita]
MLMRSSCKALSHAPPQGRAFATSSYNKERLMRQCGGAFIKSAVPGREKEGERKDGCEYGASRDGCKMKDGREEANTLLRVELGQRTNKEDKIGICFGHKEDVSTNPPSI